MVAGDSAGWIYTPQTPEDFPYPDELRPAMWVAQVFLQSKVRYVTRQLYCASDGVGLGEQCLYVRQHHYVSFVHPGSILRS
jgi:hypothetical protein